MAHIWCQN